MSVINSFILQYGLISVFVLIMIEYACFPLPSEVVLPLCGAIAARNHFGFLTILILSIIAGILGSIFCYTVGNWGGKSIINKIIEICPKAKKGIFASQDYFNKYSSISVCVCRLIPLCRTYISFIAG
ncbi:DedA family protein, partial [Clostridioides difficile]|nr:DedA family protein [Clostridioides difficile]